MKGYFVTGTDTEVGKTLFSVALLQSLAQHGWRTAALKPIAAGCELSAQGLRNDDALALQQAMTIDCPYEWVNPVALEWPVAPHLAAAQEGKCLTLKNLMMASQAILNHPDANAVVVEGAGGWHSVLLNEQESLVDYAKALNFPVILVVGMRLGCINHALLTVQAIQAAGLNLVAWMANTLVSPMPLLSENIATLQARIPAPLLGQFPAWEQIPQDLTPWLQLNLLMS